jgi:hypothetical protein
LRHLVGNAGSLENVAGEGLSGVERLSMLKQIVDGCVDHGCFLVSNCRWSERNILYRDILYLDLLSLEVDFLKREPQVDRITSSLQRIRGRRQVGRHYDKNFRQLKDVLLPSFLNWRASGLLQHKKKFGTFRPPMICYTRKVGFYWLKDVGSKSLQVVKPGLTSDFKRGLGEMPFGRVRDGVVSFKMR